MKNTTAVGIILVFILLLLVFAIANQPAPINVNPDLLGVGVDVAPDRVDWGSLRPGGVYTSAVQVNNTGTVPITLKMNTSGWQPPEAEDYLTLGWDYRNQTVDAAQQINVTLTLAVAWNVTGFTDFRFNVTISGR